MQVKCLGRLCLWLCFVEALANLRAREPSCTRPVFGWCSLFFFLGTAAFEGGFDFRGKPFRLVLRVSFICNLHACLSLSCLPLKRLLSCSQPNLYNLSMRYLLNPNTYLCSFRHPTFCAVLAERLEAPLVCCRPLVCPC